MIIEDKKELDSVDLELILNPIGNMMILSELKKLREIYQ